eukprot:GHVU01090355.1.p1 GENE.GHVU01090355.1~~GHVU01090355.1.p1  ORF type:complete len:131 (+),score=5.53 GHVU01090355.1:99-491(+)
MSLIPCRCSTAAAYAHAHTRVTAYVRTCVRGYMSAGARGRSFQMGIGGRTLLTHMPHSPCPPAAARPPYPCPPSPPHNRAAPPAGRGSPSSVFAGRDGMTTENPPFDAVSLRPCERASEPERYMSRRVRL